jgi:hypothetical protein
VCRSGPCPAHEDCQCDRSARECEAATGREGPLEAFGERGSVGNAARDGSGPAGGDGGQQGEADRPAHLESGVDEAGGEPGVFAGDAATCTGRLP